MTHIPTNRSAGQPRPPLIPTEDECRARIFGGQYHAGYMPLVEQLLTGEPTGAEIEEAECLLQLVGREMRRWKSAVNLRRHHEAARSRLAVQRCGCAVDHIVEAYRAGREAR